MAEEVIVRRRSQMPLAVFEMLVSSGFLAYWLFKKYELDWLLGLVIFIVSLLFISFLFFRVRIFRYVFAVLFSLGWGFLGYAFATSVTKSGVTPWVVLAVAFGLSLMLHKSYFNVETNTRTLNYR